MQKRKTYDVTALGELLVDFTDVGLAPTGMHLFAQNPGGAVANVAAAVARLGGRATFIGKVGSDMHGAFLRQQLSSTGVDVSGLSDDPDRFTSLAFVKLDKDGERSFSFARKHAADTNLHWEEVPQHLLTDTTVLSVGTLAMTDEPMRSTQIRCIEKAKAAGVRIALDPNYRAPLWTDLAAFRRQADMLLSMADYVKVSNEELELLTGTADPLSALNRLEQRGVTTAVVTLGSRGAVACSGGQSVSCSGVRCTQVDATGAGDAFWGGFLFRLLHQNYPLAGQTPQQLLDCLTFANLVGGYCVSHMGAINGMPTMAQLEETD